VSKKSFDRFGLGAVVVPARDSVLKELGFDVRSLGLKALGVVLDPRKTKALVAFPELAIQVWLAHGEMADVAMMATQGDSAYQNLLPNFQKDSMGVPLVFWLNKIFVHFDATYVLGLEKGLASDVWDSSAEDISKHFSGALPESIEKISVGVEEFFFDQWLVAKQLLGERLLFSRVLPAGLHKIEVAFYLRPAKRL
jgi:hypothetical protein